ncbi:apolipoprotein N-acyltransferase [Cricetibacter osteomyelitidis]|uniref:Apolipoprotein N-acyltransferase n=2 Tax=Cricetibacter osteomyelitidis TaxID=1521931 RepID=A0A4R2SZR2_9PAST|nr:apolipoprotein N-acyltransferase [Cricetibacter osteomyelitidis]
MALVSGAIGFLAFSPFDYWGVAYVSLLGLIVVAKNPSKKTALWSGFLWGLSFFSIGVSWLHVSIHQFGGSPLVVSYLLVVLLSAYLALFPTLFVYIVQRFQVKSAVLFAVIWTATEFLRSWLFTGFPWLQFGYTQIDSPFFGLAPIFGVTGITFFVMWVSAVIFNLISALFGQYRKINVAVASVLMLAVVGGLSAFAGSKQFVKEVPEKALTVTLAQGNIEQNLKWDPDYLYRTIGIYEELIRENLGKSDVIILPESAIPMLENQLTPMLDSWQKSAEKAGTEIILGTVFEDNAMGKLFNSIIVLGNSQQPYNLATTNRYNKHHLVPFGEYVPLESLLRPLGSVFNLPMSAFQSGAEVQEPLMVQGRNFTSAICYEIIFGSQLQRNIGKQTDFILTISNDAWFGDSIGPWQHLQMARMRALELGKPVIRATNTGITAFIDAQGKIVEQARQFESLNLTRKIAPTEGKTPYAILGNMPLYVMSLMFVLIRILGAVILRRIKNNAK